MLLSLRPPLFPYTTLFRSWQPSCDRSNRTDMMGWCWMLWPGSSGRECLMMTDYHIQPNTRRCAVTGRELPPGTRFYSVLLRSEEHTSELQSHHDLVCRLLL